MSLISVDVSANSFEGRSGRKYIVYPSLSTERYRVFESLQLEMEYGVTLSGFKTELETIYRLLNELKFADAAVMVNNAINGASRIESGGPHPLLMICALFICPADEDQGRWNEAEAAEKVGDWANIDVAFFLSCAKRLFHRYLPGSDTVSRSSSGQVGETDGQT